MLHKSLILSAILFFGLGLSSIQAQETILATGGNASGSGGSVSYSVGQIVYPTNTGPTGSVAQGVQQPFEISVLRGIEETAISLTISVYPNPTNDFLALNVDVSDLLRIQSLRYKLYDINGKLLENKKVTGNVTIIVMKNFVPACYFVKITDGNKEIKVFKIIKT